RALIGEVFPLDFKLATSAIEVSAVTVVAAAGVEVRTSEVATNVTPQQIERLPTASRNFLDLAALAPGVTTSEDRVNGIGFRTFQGGGASANQSNIFVDGTSLKNDLTGGGVTGQDASRGNPFPRSAIQEYRLFFFGSYEGNYQNRDNTVAFRPPSGIAGLDTVNLTKYNGNFTSPFRESLGFGKLTYIIDPKSTAELSVNQRHETDIRDFGNVNCSMCAYEEAVNFRQNVTIAQLKYSRFAGSWLNETKVDYSRF